VVGGEDRGSQGVSVLYAGADPRYARLR
jgi:hypothetical protein